MAQNRRVDIVLLSAQSESVRALIPQALDLTSTLPASAP
jgi:hypothetical protein